MLGFRKAICLLLAFSLAFHVFAAKRSVAAIMQVPVLCYHQLRPWQTTDSKTARTYITPPATFYEHMKVLRDSGYHPILPDELVAYLQNGAPLPSRPVMITFDDGALSQYQNAEPILEKAGIKAVFFIMTVTLSRHNFMSAAQVRDLARKGHVIGCHTWDHHNVTGYKETDWDKQIVKPVTQLRQITGKEIKYFAYPNGIWSADAISRLKTHGYTAAFQLSGKCDVSEPLFTIRRIIVDGHWNGRQLLNAIRQNFK